MAIVQHFKLLWRYRLLLYIQHGFIYFCISNCYYPSEFGLLVMYIKDFVFGQALCLTNLIFIILLLVLSIYLPTCSDLKNWEKFWSCHYNLNHAFPFSIFDNFSAPGSFSALIKRLLVYQVCLGIDRPGDTFIVRIYFNSNHD